MDTAQRDSFTAQLIGQYIAMWHEPDATRRRAIVEQLWAPDAENFTRTFTVRGLEQIVQRVDKAHAEWVARRDFVFRPQTGTDAGNTDSHNHLIKFHWEMLPRAGGALEARGLDILVLDEAGKIRSLYQFAEPLPDC
ncbi:MAG: hypothetical protein ABIT82_09280 [Ramlibacter sp.]